MLEKLPARRIVVVLIALAGVGLVGGYGVAMRARPKAAKIALSSPAIDAKAGRQVYVHVGGAVRRPGLYELPDGSRVFDAVQAAGGATDDADLDSLNLASKVKDGDKVLVPQLVEPGADPPAGGTAATGAGGPAGGLINLNSATPEQLDSLPGIGPSTAQKIIAYRTEHGGFRTIDELMEVPGIGPAKFEELKARVTV